ncbi:MAG: hypothetical protein ACI4AK_02400 [Lepagella sp.]
MTITRSKYLILTAVATLLALTAIPASAQYDQQINVEGEYVPEYINHDRIGLFPRPLKLTAEESQLDYSTLGVAANFNPQALPIEATAWGATRDYSTRRGYLDLGLGSWLESTLAAGYRFIDNSSSSLGIRLQHNSTSLWKPRLSPATADNKMWRYDEAIGIYGHHSWSGKGTLSAAIDYHIGNFNYYGFAPTTPDLDAPIESPTQTLHDISARLRWQSPAHIDNILWHAELGVRHLSFRRLYMPNDADPTQLLSASGSRETDINLNGGFSFPTSTKSTLGIDLNADYVTYNKDISTYQLVTLTPYYRFTHRRINLRIGAKFDLAFKAGPETNRYPTVHFAPDVKFDFNAGPVALYLHFLGGSNLHTLANIREYDYYQMPSISNSSPVYTPLDAHFGLRTGPFSGFHAGIDVAYRTSRNQHLGGLYNTWLCLGIPVDGCAPLPVADDAGRAIIVNTDPECRANVSGFSFGVNIGYDSGRYFKIEAEGRYQHQNGKTGYFNGYDRPEWTAQAAIESNPWSTLRFRLGYELRALRRPALRARYADASAIDPDIIVNHRLPNYSGLSFGASYGITSQLSVWAQADNLLCRRNYSSAGLPESSIRAAAGISLTF